MMHERFACYLIDTKGRILRINIFENDPAYMDMLNTLCGAKPLIWIGSNSHDKVFRLDDKLRIRLLEIVDHYVLEEKQKRVIDDFISGIRHNGLLAFLREGLVKAIDDNQIFNALVELQKIDIPEVYNVIDFGNDLAFTGPPDLKQCVCRFCKESYPNVHFKKKNAHAIPEALGNKTIFCNDECKECNHTLANVENNLIYYLNFRRADAKINGKKGVVTNTGQNYVNDGKTGKIEISDEAIINVIDDNNVEAKCLDARLITHPGIYRALAKIAIDLIPNELLSDFDRTIEWIKGNIHPNTIPDVLYSYRANIKSQPTVKLFIKKDIDIIKEYPRCIVCLDLIDLRFYYIVPFAKSDGVNLICSDSMKTFMPFLSSLDNDCSFLERIDMSEREGKYSHVISRLNPKDISMVEKGRFDSVKERNPNKVDFPDLDRNKVKVKGINIVNLLTNEDAGILKNSKIEYVAIDIENFKVHFRKGCFFLNITFRISNVITEEILFLTTIHVVVTYTNLNRVRSIINDEVEISYHLVKYMVELGIIKLKERLYVDMPEFDFNRLTQFIIENHLYVLPKE